MGKEIYAKETRQNTFPNLYFNQACISKLMENQTKLHMG